MHIRRSTRWIAVFAIVGLIAAACGDDDDGGDAGGNGGEEETYTIGVSTPSSRTRASPTGVQRSITTSAWSRTLVRDEWEGVPAID